MTRMTLEAGVMRRLEALMSQRRRSFCARPLHREVSLPQLHILMLLRDSPPLTVSELAQTLQISTPSASAIIDRMAEHGLVERVRDATDRRVVHVEISARGKEMVDEIVGLRREGTQRLLGAMTEDELRAVEGGLDALQAALSRLDGAEVTPRSVPA